MSDQKSYEESATRGLVDGGASAGRLNEHHRARNLMKRMLSTCHMLHDEKNSLFMLGGHN